MGRAARRRVHPPASPPRVTPGRPLAGVPPRQRSALTASVSLPANDAPDPAKAATRRHSHTKQPQRPLPQPPQPAPVVPDPPVRPLSRLLHADQITTLLHDRGTRSSADSRCGYAMRGTSRKSPAIRELRELTRYRKTQIDARVAEIQRLEKVLQDAGVKLTSVASKVLTRSGRSMIEALIAGEKDPAKLAGLPRARYDRRYRLSQKHWPGTSARTTLWPVAGSSITSTSLMRRSRR